MSIACMNAVWNLSKQDSSLVLLLLAIADSANDEFFCWPSLPKLAEKARASVRQTQRNLQTLVNSGELYYRSGGGFKRSSTYLVLIGLSTAEKISRLQKYFFLSLEEAVQVAAGSNTDLYISLLQQQCSYSLEQALTIAADGEKEKLIELIMRYFQLSRPEAEQKIVSINNNVNMSPLSTSPDATTEGAENTERGDIAMSPLSPNTSISSQQRDDIAMSPLSLASQPDSQQSGDIAMSSLSANTTTIFDESGVISTERGDILSESGDIAMSGEPSCKEPSWDPPILEPPRRACAHARARGGVEKSDRQDIDVLVEAEGVATATVDTMSNTATAADSDRLVTEVISAASSNSGVARQAQIASQPASGTPPAAERKAPYRTSIYHRGKSVTAIPVNDDGSSEAFDNFAEELLAYMENLQQSRIYRREEQKKALWFLFETGRSIEQCKVCFNFYFTQSWKKTAVTWDFIAENIARWLEQHPHFKDIGCAISEPANSTTPSQSQTPSAGMSSIEIASDALWHCILGTLQLNPVMTLTNPEFIDLFHKLKAVEATAEQFEKFCKWYKNFSWRGQKGQFPTPKEILENWQRAIDTPDAVLTGDLVSPKNQPKNRTQELLDASQRSWERFQQIIGRKN